MGFIKEFTEFASGGNLVDLAVAVVMGMAIGNDRSLYRWNGTAFGRYDFG